MKREIYTTLENKQQQPIATQTAQLLSYIFNPPLVMLPLLLVIAIGTANARLLGITWWLTATIGISIVPTIFVILGVRKGTYGDLFISERSHRIIPLLVGLICICLTSFILLAEHASRPFMLTIISVLVTSIIATLITSFWKISFHVAVITGAVTTLTIVFGLVWLLIAPLIPIVAWARWIVKAHTPAQMLAGALVASSMTGIVFFLSSL
jgi:hypothetical protein